MLNTDKIIVGQLLTHPLHPERDSFHAHKKMDGFIDYHILRGYRDVFSVDTEGRFMRNYGAKFDLANIYRQPNLLTVAAERMIQRTIDEPLHAFDVVCKDPLARQWIVGLAKDARDFYIVVGVTELHQATFKRAKLKDAGASRVLQETPLEKGARVPFGGPGGGPHFSGIFGLDVRRCVARITTPAEPHHLEDIAYHWVYYDLPNSTTKEQLMIGLGDPLKANELRLMLDLTKEDVQFNLDAISQLSLDALSAAASPMLRPSPTLRGRSPSPNPELKLPA